MKREGFWYLASPYSKYAYGHERAFFDAAVQTSILIRAGHAVFSPIVHSHPLVVCGGMAGQTDFEAWREFDETMMARSCGLIICKLQGWDQSMGVKAEMEWFMNQGVAPIFMEPGEIPPALA